MNKTEFVKRLSARLSLPPKAIVSLLDAFNDELSKVLNEDNHLVLKDFGTYYLWEQTERIGRNPKSGVSCVIPFRRSVKFKPGKGLLKELNKGEGE